MVVEQISSPTKSTQEFPFNAYQLLLFFFVFLITAILTGVKLHIIVLFICISLMICETEHFCMHLLAIYMSFFEKCLFSLSICFTYLFLERGQGREKKGRESSMCERNI